MMKVTRAGLITFDGRTGEAVLVGWDVDLEGVTHSLTDITKFCLSYAAEHVQEPVVLWGGRWRPDPAWVGNLEGSVDGKGQTFGEWCEQRTT